MHAIFIRLSLALFGLEYSILNSVSEVEKNKFVRLSFLFLTVALACVLSSSFLIFLLYSSIWLSIILGPIISLVFISTIRFSILTIQRSLYEEKASVILIEGDKPNANKNKIKQLINSIHLPGIESIMRTIINGIISCLIIFPLVSLIHYQNLERLNQEKKQIILNEFSSAKKKSFLQANKSTSKKIHDLDIFLKSNSDVKSQGGVFLTKLNEMNTLKFELKQNFILFNLELEKQILELSSDLNSKYFIIYIFSKAITYPDFTIVAILILVLLFYIHYLQNSLKTNDSYQYTKLAKQKYVEIVNKDYTETKSSVEKKLMKRFPNFKINIDEMSRWKNPPFNTEEKKVFTERTEISKATLINSLVTK